MSKMPQVRCLFPRLEWLYSTTPSLDLRLEVPKNEEIRYKITGLNLFLASNIGRVQVDVNRLLTSRKSLDCKFMRTDTCRNSTSSRRSVSAGSAKQSAPPSSPVKVPPIDDDLICRIGCRGRAKGEFTNPQVKIYHCSLMNLIRLVMT